MKALAGSLYLVSTVAFCAVALGIGVRLVLLSRRTGAPAERLLGFGVGLTGGVGYGVLIAAALVRQASGGEGSALLAWASALGKLAHDAGVVCMLGFVVHVFRPGVVWARALAVAMTCVLWLGFAGYALGGNFSHGRPEGFWYWLEFAVIGTYPVWTAAESLAWWSRMRRRRALGLGEPLVQNRFLLWGVGSLLALAAIWTITLPALRASTPEELSAASPVYMLVTALWGIGAIAAYALAFFPPAWYRARVAGDGDAVPAPAERERG